MGGGEQLGAKRTRRLSKAEREQMERVQRLVQAEPFQGQPDRPVSIVERIKSHYHEQAKAAAQQASHQRAYLPFTAPSANQEELGDSSTKPPTTDAGTSMLSTEFVEPHAVAAPKISRKPSYIKDRAKRRSLCAKRRKALMKGVYELSVSTGSDVLLLVATEDGSIFTHSSPRLKHFINDASVRRQLTNALSADTSNELDELDLEPDLSADEEGATDANEVPLHDHVLSTALANRHHAEEFASDNLNVHAHSAILEHAQLHQPSPHPHPHLHMPQYDGSSQDSGRSRGFPLRDRDPE